MSINTTRTVGTTTTTKHFRRCDKCRKSGEAVYYANPNGKFLCAECFGIKPEDSLVRIVED